MKARIVWLILCGIWGSTWLFIKLGLADLPPLTFAGIRFLLAGLILTAIVLARRVRWPRAGRDWMLIAIVGFLQFTLNYGLVFWGEQHIPSGLAAVLQSTFPAFGLVIAHLYLPHERITLLKVIGVLMGIVGISIIFSDQLSVAGHMALLGSIALVLSAFFGAYGNVLVKAYSQKIDPLVLAAPTLLLFGISFLALRLLLFVLRRLDGRIGRTRKVSAYLAGRRVGRSPGTGFAAALLLLLAMGLLVVSTSYRAIVLRNHADAAHTQASAPHDRTERATTPVTG